MPSVSVDSSTHEKIVLLRSTYGTNGGVVSAARENASGRQTEQVMDAYLRELSKPINGRISISVPLDTYRSIRQMLGIVQAKEPSTKISCRAMISTIVGMMEEHENKNPL